MAAEVRVLAPNAAKESVTEAIPVFEKGTGHKVVIAWSGTEAITKRIAEGEVVDVVVNAAQNIDRQSDILQFILRIVLRIILRIRG
jgi:molybdate transport system substrate-binding protein